MSIRWTEDDLKRWQERHWPGAGKKRSGSTQEAKPKREPRVKGYKPTVVDGMRFDSKAEARFYETLKADVGERFYFLRQVPLHLPGGVIWRIDFQTFQLRTTYDREAFVRWIDVKGHITQEFKTKKRIAEATYPIKIEIVRWKGGRWIYE